MPKIRKFFENLFKTKQKLIPEDRQPLLAEEFELNQSSEVSSQLTEESNLSFLPHHNITPIKPTEEEEIELGTRILNQNLQAVGLPSISGKQKVDPHKVKNSKITPIRITEEERLELECVIVDENLRAIGLPSISSKQRLQTPKTPKNIMKES